MEVGLSLGSNLGDRLAHLREARDAIARLPGVSLEAQAAVYETEPVGVQPAHRHLKFLNTALVIRSDRVLDELQRDLASLELALGRVREADRFAPRAIDIDLLYADAVWMETDRLTLPHPRWATRRFVVQPLADIRPALVLPGAGRSVREILDALPGAAEVALFAAAEDW